jgi:AcrR family transcriptional regulator
MQADRKTKWQLKREASYEALVEAAARRFHDHGYAVTRVEDIVSDAGYTSGAFYFHFANKAECFWHVIDARERQRGDWTRLLDGLDPAAVGLADVLARVFSSFAETLQGLNDWILVMVDFRQQHRDDPEVGLRLREIYARWHDELARFVVALGRGGWIPAETDAALVATEAFAFAEGLTTHVRLYDIDEVTARKALIGGLVRLFAGRPDPA